MPHFIQLPAPAVTWKFVSAKPSGEITTPEPPSLPLLAKIASVAARGLGHDLHALRFGLQNGLIDVGTSDVGENARKCECKMQNANANSRGSSHLACIWQFEI